MQKYFIIIYFFAVNFSYIPHMRSANAAEEIKALRVQIPLLATGESLEGEQQGQIDQNMEEWKKEKNFSTVLDQTIIDNQTKEKTIHQISGMAEPKTKQDIENIVKLSPTKQVTIISLTDSNNIIDKLKQENDSLAANIQVQYFPFSENAMFNDLKNNEDKIFAAVERAFSEGRTVLVHCREGINRTGMVLASLLKNLGVEQITAIQKLSPRGTPLAAIKMVYR